MCITREKQLTNLDFKKKEAVTVHGGEKVK